MKTLPIIFSRFFACSLLFSIAVSLGGCWLTDQHDPEQEGVSSDMISNPHSAYDKTNKEELPAFSFEEQTYDFGRIAEGEKVHYTFRFHNTGGKALLISAVEPSCGCTVPEGWPKEPIPPGEEGVIEVVYDSEGDRGKQHKTVSVVANTSPSTTMLALEGEVMAPGAEE